MPDLARGYVRIVDGFNRGLGRLIMWGVFVMAATEAGHTYRNQWYWGGEARLRAKGDKLKLRTVPASEWAEVEDAAKVFWAEVAQEGEIQSKIVSIFREYNDVINQAGPPYNFG